ncbi:uncharacterized protein LOC142177210 [Nicotiana tabacum]|uniref:Uncharacterized protein LOC142177210 n=1 Tax=Nicotiana tabacum TaxID=4097 RepID=A0AC58TX36_TOBAC
MSAPPGIDEGQSTTRPPMFNEKYYSWWKARMEDFLTVEDYELWTIATKQNVQSETVPKDPFEFVAADFRMIEKNAKAKKILTCGLSPDEYNRISARSNANETCDALQTAHEGTNQEYEPIQEMMTRFTIITNKLKSLGKVFTLEELVIKVLRILPASRESKFTAIEEAKELDKISLDELEEPKRDKALVLKAFEEDESDSNDPDLAMFPKFKRFMKNSKNTSKRETNGKPKPIEKANYDGCYKCSKLDHMVKDCPMWEIEWRKERAEKEKWEKMREKGSNKRKILGKGFTEAIKQDFLTAYEDNGSDK